MRAMRTACSQRSAAPTSDNALSAKLYEHAVALAARHGRAFSDVLLMALTNSVDEAGKAQQLQTVLLDT